MQEILTQLLELSTVDLTWKVLFIGLFIYHTKRCEKREDMLLEHIERWFDRVEDQSNRT